MCKISLDLTCMTWSDLGQMRLIPEATSVHESLGPILAEHNQPATSFPASDLVAFFHWWPRS